MDIFLYLFYPVPINVFIAREVAELERAKCLLINHRVGAKLLFLELLFISTEIQPARWEMFIYIWQMYIAAGCQ